MTPLPHKMDTRSKKRRNYDVDNMNINMSNTNMQESEYNLYAGQNICNIRDLNLKYYLTDVLNNPTETTNEETVYQEIYDIGCALMSLNVVKKNDQQHFKLNNKFGDYESWKPFKKTIIENCEFLQQIRHPLFQF